MPSLEAKRTLVKSPPEIWAEVSDAGALARHLGEFGEIRITRTQPESVVEWEGDLASGCVRLEPSGWGTKVTLTAEAPDPPPQQGSDLAIEHDAGLQDLTPGVGADEPVVAVPAKTSWWSRFRRRRAAEPVPEPEPVAEVAPVQAPAPPEPELAPVLDGERAQAALTGVLDTLGAAHHRPFSRP
jgi:hypothetical protein